MQRCTVHKERNLLAHAPKELHDAETAAMLFRELMASGQITMLRFDGWQTLEHVPSQQPIDLAA